MFCEKCGAELSGDAASCGACGEKVSADTTGQLENSESANDEKKAQTESSNLTEDTNQPADVGLPEQASESSLPHSEGELPLDEWRQEGVDQNAEIAEQAESTEIAAEASNAANINIESTNIAPAENLENASSTENAGKKKLAFILGGAAAVVAVIALCAFIMLGTGLNGILLKTQRAYSAEFSDLVSKNEVLSAVKSSYAKSNTQTFDFSGSSLKINDDQQGKALELELITSAMPLPMSLFISNSQLIAGINNYILLEVNPTDISGDLEEFIENSGGEAFDLGAMLAPMIAAFEGVNLSYDAVKSGDMNTILGDDEISERYARIFRELLKKADYENGSSTLTIGEKEVKTKHMVLSFSNGTIAKWVKEDLLPVLSGDDELDKKINQMNNIASVFFGGTFFNSSYFIESLTEFANKEPSEADEDLLLKIKLDVVKGVIVKAELELPGGVDNPDYMVNVSIAALGEKNRIEKLEYVVGDSNGESISMELEGEFIGVEKPQVTAVVRDADYSEEVTINWDTKGTKKNFVVSGMDSEGGHTFAKTEDGAYAEYYFYADAPEATWKVSPLTDAVLIPSDSSVIKLSERSFDDVMKSFEGFLGGVMN